MSETKTTGLLTGLVKKVAWYDYIGFVVWAVLLYLSLDMSLSFLSEAGTWGIAAGWIILGVFFAILIIGPAIRLGLYYTLQRRSKTKTAVKP